MKVESTVVPRAARSSPSARSIEGISSWLERLPTLWVEGEVTELRRQLQWATVYFTLKDPENGACLAVQMKRGLFDGLRLELGNGERVHVYGRPELYEQRGDFLAARASSRSSGSGSVHTSRRSRS